MPRVSSYDRAALAAEQVIRDQAIRSLKVDPVAIAKSLSIDVVEKPPSRAGVSGMLLRLGEDYCIAYATHIQSSGFQRFSIAHELGHYFLPGHMDALFAERDVHESRAGRFSDDQYEGEADRFAARLLMPNSLFLPAVRHAGEGLAAIERLAEMCETSLSATGIRYAEALRDPLAVVVSSGASIDYWAMSEPLKDCDGIDWLRKGQPLPLSSLTREFNKDPAQISRGDREKGDGSFQDWFGGKHRTTVREEVLGLGAYGKTLTVLYDIELPEDADDEEELEDSWTPRFRRG